MISTPFPFALHVEAFVLQYNLNSEILGWGLSDKEQAWFAEESRTTDSWYKIAWSGRS